MKAQVTDFDDPELDDPEPIRKQKERHMAEEKDVAEARECKVLAPVHIKGVLYHPGETALLTEEEYRTCVDAGVLFEGEEVKTPEQVQEAHDAGVEAQKEKIETLEAEAQKEKTEAAEAKVKESQEK
jgi:hypothetical protein